MRYESSIDRNAAVAARMLSSTAALAIALAAAPATLLAQAELDEVVVTAQKREQRISEVPISMQALGGTELERTGVRDLNQLITSIPGASEGRSLAAGSRSYQIRGVASYYGDATVGYYLDDAVFTVLNRNFAPVATAFDVDRVEVLRGPQGTLYGSGAMGGTIRFITADPDLEQPRFRGYAGFSATDEDGDDNYYGNFAASVPLIADKLAVRVAASYDHQGGYAASPSFPGRLNEVTAENYRIKLLAKPTDAFTLKLTYQQNEIDDPLGRQMRVTDPGVYYPSTLGGAPLLTNNVSEYDLFGAFLSYDFGGFAIESSTGYLDREASGNVPIDVGAPGDPPALSTAGESDTLSSELRVVSRSDGPFNWILGALYQDASAREDVLLRLTGPMGIILPLRNEDSRFESESYALFGEVSWSLLGGKLVPLLGVRYFEDDRSFVNFSPKGAAVPSFSTEALAGDVGSFDSVNGRFNLSWFPREGALVYLNVASGFRSGTFNTTAGRVAASRPPLLLDVPYGVQPDELISYEVGTKLNRGPVSLELAAYYIDWTDVQLNFSAPGNVQYIANAGDVKGLGVDYGLNWQIADALLLQLSGNLNDTELDRLAPGFSEFGNVRVGRQLSSVPEQTHRVALSYRRALAGSGLDLIASGSYAYTDEQGDPGDLPRRFGGTQELASLRLGVENERWGVRLVGDNLLGESDPIQVSGSGSTRVYPRTYGIEFNFEF